MHVICIYDHIRLDMFKSACPKAPGMPRDACATMQLPLNTYPVYIFSLIQFVDPRLRCLLLIQLCQGFIDDVNGFNFVAPQMQKFAGLDSINVFATSKCVWKFDRDWGHSKIISMLGDLIFMLTYVDKNNCMTSSTRAFTFHQGRMSLAAPPHQTCC